MLSIFRIPKFLSSIRANPLPHIPSFFNSLPNNKILEFTKLEAFADDKIKVAQMMISVFDR